MTSTAAEATEFTLAFTVKNPHKEKSLNRQVQQGALTLIRLGNDSLAADDPAFGDLTLATDAAEVSIQEYWFRGGWFDNLGVWWRDFTAPGPLRNRTYPAGTGVGQDHASLAARLTVPGGGTGKIRFVLTWNYPNATKCSGGASITRWTWNCSAPTRG